MFRHVKVALSPSTRFKARLCLALLAAWSQPAGAGAGIPLKAGPAAVADARLHVASPDWRDQVIYFVMTDRFDDGDPGNDNQSVDEFDPADTAKYNGGDLRGLIRRLDYIQGLGATALWVTPPVANRWWDPVASHGGYHGYWAENFMKVDAHLGTLADYQALSRALHGRGMYLVQDIVLNHTANYFYYGSGWRPDRPAADFQLTPDSRGNASPTQWPFNLNDPRQPKQRTAAIYHWTPNLLDFNDAHQVFGYQMAGLDDLNSENPVVRAALRKSYGYWIREAGVDAFRIDTVFYVPVDAVADFMNSEDPANPGMLQVARATGRAHFHAFGEGFATDKPFDDRQANRIDSYMRRPDGSPVLPGMINFPLYASIGDVFARGHPTAEMAYRIESMMRVHEHPELMPTFLDNHDVDRFLAGGGEAGLKQGLLLLMTLPGIPTLYYGTEQGFRKPRAAMFKAGSDSGGVDHFDTGAGLYRFIQRTTTLRREHRLFSRGRPQLLKSSAAGPGVLAYRMSEENESAIVAFNTSDADVLVDNLDTGAPAGTALTGIFDIAGRAENLVAGSAGRVSFILPARAGRAWLLGQAQTRGPAPLRARSDAAIAIDALPRAVVVGDFTVAGSARGLRQLKLVVDGQLAWAQSVKVAPDGRWHARVDTGRMIDPGVGHELVAWSDSAGLASAGRRFSVSQPWKLLYDADDPGGDDKGPQQRYQYPLEGGWREHRQPDIRHVSIEGAGGAMRISLRMNDVTRLWNPPNGFDHVAFSIFVQVPGRAGGSAVLPFQNAQLPAGMQWNYRLRAHGWSNALFTSQNAANNRDGTPGTPAAGIAVDAATRTIRFTLSSDALGGLHSLDGVKVYAATWDYDGGFRPLAAQAGPSAFGGGDGAVDALVMDDTAVITLP